MATVKEVKDAQGNKAEAAATPGQPVPAADVSVPTGKPKTEATKAEKAEGAANEAEARADENERQGNEAVKTEVSPHTANNRRISKLLASQRQEKPAQVRRLQAQVKRLQAQAAGKSVTVPPQPAPANIGKPVL